MSPIGYGQEQNLVNLGDTAEIIAAIADVDDQVVPAGGIASASMTIQAPDATQDTITADIRPDGSAYGLYEDTTAVGEYIVVTTFVLADGVRRSVRADFEVKDPFAEGTTALDQIADQVWLRIEDCFDSAEGGPWLRDQTLRFFNKEKISNFIPEALMHINLQPPMTNATIESFTTPEPTGDPDLDRPILVQGTLIAVIHHLMRSYVEQYLPTGGEVTYLSRRDYLERWGSILQFEQARFEQWLALWKRQFLNLGHSKLLVGSKAGRLGYPGQRARTIGRGWL